MKNNTLIKLGGSCLLLSLLAGCNSSDNAGSSIASSLLGLDRNADQVLTQQPPESTPAPSETPIPRGQQPDQPLVVSTAELEAPQDFDFSSHYDLEVHVDIRELTENRTYLNVCRAIDGGAAEPEIDYENCIVRSSVMGGELLAKVQLTNDEQLLIAEIVRFDAEPSLRFYKEFKGDSTDKQWFIPE